jgi:hypothetical protein
MQITYEYNILGVYTIDANVTHIKIENSLDYSQANCVNEFVNSNTDFIPNAFENFKNNTLDIILNGIDDANTKSNLVKELDKNYYPHLKNSFKLFVLNTLSSFNTSLDNNILLLSQQDVNKEISVVNVPKFISKIEWEKIGTDEFGNTGSVSSYTIFSPTSEKINTTSIQFEDITKDILCSWIEQSETTGKMNFSNGQIAQEIQAKRFNEQKIESLPW